ncbi:PREDICTED: uncharacterized protein LOC108563688 [Nicrophorus vespilloides]|uniref:Uncharacterized protein LOC108563688 n=1 Tax=Nicrophorus vespilloides TaxID=110193 RepID=A0ABM1MTM3_NICVS|nr:PREDICTED: uncharacterized protein LOC108563688 [Nicrophorus vespilloides]
MTRPFDFGKLTAALSRAKDSAPGTDLVTAAMLRNLPKVGKQRLLMLYNEVFNNCSFPSAWYIIKIVPILKKEAATDLAAIYRPIALMSSVKKCLEVMLKTRLERFVESRSILPTSFSGFRKGRGTNDNICTLLAKIHKTLSRRSKDKCLHISGSNPDSDSRCSYIGLPQGSPLSPLLFNLYIHAINDILPEGVEILAYADDLAICCAGADSDQLEKTMNTALDNISNYLGDRHMEAVPAKTKAMIFTRKRSPAQPLLTINGSAIEIVNEFRFLGVTLDDKLSWKSQARQSQSCFHGLNILKVVSGRDWGCDPITMLTLFKAFILSRLHYACFIYSHCAKSTLRILDRIQNQALRICMGAMRSTPINVLHDASVMPLSIQRRMLTKRLLLRNLAIGETSVVIPSVTAAAEAFSSKPYWRRKEVPLIIKCMVEIEDLRPSVDSSAFERLYMHPLVLPLRVSSRKFSKKRDEFGNSYDRIFAEFVESHYDGFLRIYTDGSIRNSPKSVTYGIAIPYICECRRLPSSCSIFTAELNAICRVVNIASVIHGARNVAIFSDSLSSIRSIFSEQIKIKTNPWVVEAINSLNRLAAGGIRVELCWVPSHQGITGYEHANDAANEGHSIDDPLEIKIPHTDFFFDHRRLALAEWQRKFDSDCATKGKYNHQLNKVIGVKPWFVGAGIFKKCQVSSIGRLRSGHTLAPIYIHRSSHSCVLKGVNKTITMKKIEDALKD